MAAYWVYGDQLWCSAGKLSLWSMPAKVRPSPCPLNCFWKEKCWGHQNHVLQCHPEICEPSNALARHCQFVANAFGSFLPMHWPMHFYPMRFLLVIHFFAFGFFFCAPFCWHKHLVFSWDKHLFKFASAQNLRPIHSLNVDFKIHRSKGKPK